MRRLAGSAAFVSVLVLLPSAAGSAAAAGLHGFVRKGPLTPVCREDVPCYGPAAGVVLRFTRADGVVVRTRTRSTGFYRVSLAPGRYAVTAEIPRRQGFTEKTIRARDGTDGRIDFEIDTGIQ